MEPFREVWLHDGGKSGGGVCRKLWNQDGYGFVWGCVCVCVRVLFHIKFPMFNWFLLNECQFPMVQPITRQRY